ncbi:hypothetical protein [Leptolyngbya ohadii]|uniref:hypothetical protein n=1 Tax=Leptolyngbya ohadii TaxID=1962290 RepID=UPI000B59B740|nr:hypothetical protein [Leptolyngbya ohadii]
MQFTLRSRFRGALLGAALGEVFGTIALQSGMLAQPSLSLRDATHIWRLNLFPEAEQRAESGLSSRPFLALANALIQPPILQAQVVQSPVRTEQNRSTQKPDSAIDLLPLILFCHESQTQIQQSLVPQLAHLPVPRQTELLTIALIVSGILQEQFRVDRGNLGTSLYALMEHPLLEELPKGLRSGKQSAPIMQGNSAAENCDLRDQLQQVQTWLEQDIPLTMLPEILSPVAAALYGMLKTPTVFPLALLHTLRLNPDPEAAALMGLFAGAHLSEAGLPIGWRLAIDRDQSNTLKHLWGIASVADLLELSDRLWAAWSGAFQPYSWQSAKSSAGSTVTAIPRLVRPR